MAESTENQGHPGLHEDRETRETHEYREDRSRSDSSDRDENRASRERRSSRLGPLPVGYQLRSSRTTFRFASSKLDLIKNPLQQPEAEEGESLITDKDKHRQSLPGQRVNSDELPLQFAKVHRAHRDI